ncbi:MAG: hypothetical protein GW886_08880 [Rhodobacterales bacterium]|nr:hypothetical protein [Rhodobacterales bacterium]NCT12955.1 hypothetical protein [Rhodobacterales bacterium]
MRRFALPALMLATTPALADMVGQPLATDLNGDRRAEVFTLQHNGDGSADLSITDTGGRGILAQDIAWIGGPGQEPELGLAPNGSVTLTSKNDSVGRNRWFLTLTIAWRDNAYRVAGYTYTWYDTLDLAAYGVCDINLLTGRGTARIGDAAAQPVTVPRGAPAVTDWKEAAFRLPPACQG